MSVKRLLRVGVSTLLGVSAGALGAMSVRFLLGRARADRVWNESRYDVLKGMGSVKRLRILPLIDWYAESPRLATEPGVSYLVEADDTKILFDVGYNMNGEHPSPLLRNMEALGVSLDDVDMVFISHAHCDHLGGMNHQMEGTFALSAEPVDLHGVPAYVPQPMENTSARVTLTEHPRILAPGVASIGAIPRQLFFFGWTPEQSLAVNVAGKGIVLIVGCGHSTLQRIVKRAEGLFEERVYGVVGGLHYPVVASREDMYGLPAQQIFGTGKWPWDPVNRGDVFKAISFLRARKPGLVSLSAHDSCDWSLDAFRRAFGGAYRDLVVGREITVN
jgi:7,8-dihydropterin-6-yl-methyl-4-(beta-D-ribofuranosyl)aminobenzene 5'-phosphate synthase